jgi:hypothetical protein
MAGAMQGAMMAHINEHLGFLYRQQIEERIGAPLPPPDAELSPEEEVAMSRFVAEASKQVLQIHQGEAAQQQNQQMAQDPLIQMQQQELQIKAAEVQRKAQKDAIDAQETRERLDIEKARLAQQERQSNAKNQIDIFKDANRNRERSQRRSPEK